MDITKITLNLPTEFIRAFQDMYGKRKISATISKLMDREMKVQKKKEFEKRTCLLAEKIDKLSKNKNIDSIIKMYKDDRR